MTLDQIKETVQSIPHIGQILAATMVLGITIYKEMQNLEHKSAEEKALAKDADSLLSLIGGCGQKLSTADPRKLERLKVVLDELHKVVDEICHHICEAARGRHVLIGSGVFGEHIARARDIIFKPTEVLRLKRKLKEAKENFINEYKLIKNFSSLDAEGIPPPYNLEESKEHKGMELERHWQVAWVDEDEIEKNPSIKDQMIPVCRPEDSDDGMQWYIARVSYFGGYQPGKYKSKDEVYFGHHGKSIDAKTLDVGMRKIHILVAKPGAVHWHHMSGKYSRDGLGDFHPVEGCYENDHTELVIARAKAREHMHIGILTPMTLQLGKASPKLDGAYVIAGKKEVNVEDYEVLVYAADASGSPEVLQPRI